MVKLWLNWLMMSCVGRLQVTGLTSRLHANHSCMYTWSWWIKCMHVGSIKTDSASLCGGVQGGWANRTYSSGSLEGWPHHLAEKTVKSETTSQQGVGLLRECLNVCVCVPGRKGSLKVNEMTAESQVQLINSEHLDLKENGENTWNNLTDLYNHHWTVFVKFGPEDTIEDLFKSSPILYIDCYPMCVNQASGSFRSVEQGMDFLWPWRRRLGA